MASAGTTQMRHALLAAGVDVAGVAQGHLGVGGVQAADVVVGQAAPGADEHLPQRPAGRRLALAHAAASRSRRRRLAA